MAVALRLVAALLLATSPIHLLANDLLGCWRSERTTLLLPDGQEKVNDTGNCVLQFSADRITSTCQIGSDSAVIEYSYEVVREGVYNATMHTNSAAQSEQAKAQIGGSREYEFRVDRDRLSLTTFPQTTKPKSANPFVKVESVSRRVSC